MTRQIELKKTTRRDLMMLTGAAVADWNAQALKSREDWTIASARR